MQRHKQNVSTVQAICWGVVSHLSITAISYQSWGTNLHWGDPYRWTNSRQKYVTGYLPDHITSGPTRLHIVQLVAIQPQLLFPSRTNSVSRHDVGFTSLLRYLHSGHESIIDISLVQILNEIACGCQLWRTWRAVDDAPKEAKVSKAKSSLKRKVRSSGDLSSVSHR